MILPELSSDDLGLPTASLMPPPPKARRSNVSPFGGLWKIGDFEKQLVIFTVYGEARSRVTLPNGDVIVKGDWYVPYCDCPLPPNCLAKNKHTVQ
jgi:hypothetical protein